MQNEQRPVEQRKERRLRVKDWVFARFRPRYATLGKIVDISRGGLAFHYVARATIGEEQKAAELEVDIFDARTGSSVSLERIPCEIAYDVFYDTSPDLAAASEGEHVTIRRCGIKFGEMPKEQLRQVETFIKKYSTDYVG